MSRKRAAPPHQHRAPGRPGADSPDLRERLLDAALACFSRHGIAATPLRAIAAEAGVNPSLLHYYFGDKTQLQQAVISERLMPVLDRLRVSLLDRGDDVGGLIAGFVEGIGRIAVEHPWLPPLWVREVLCEGGALRDLMFHQIAPKLPMMMVGKFARAQARGQLNPALDPRLLMVSLVGLTLFPAAGAPIWRRLFLSGDVDSEGRANDEPGFGESGPGETAPDRFGSDELDYEALRRHTLALLDGGLGLGGKGVRA